MAPHPSSMSSSGLGQWIWYRSIGVGLEPPEALLALALYGVFLERVEDVAVLVPQE
jgi:hypothetical protein